MSVNSMQKLDANNTLETYQMSLNIFYSMSVQVPFKLVSSVFFFFSAAHLFSSKISSDLMRSLFC